MMGSADTVPGVSGGTIAFLLGIYEQLIYSIKLLSGEVLHLIVRLKIKEAWQKVPFGFLVPLFLGMMTAILALSNGISYLLKHQPEFVWSFFFGLVLASVMVVRKRVVTWNKHDYFALVLTAIFAYFLVGSVPVETPATLLAFLLAGAVAICAMILPGISGSFLLVIMGKYEQVLTAVSEQNFLVLGAVMTGSILGLALFSRLLSWLFAKHHDIVVAALIGFMIGSLRKVWPWKEVISTRINSHGEVVPLLESNVLPILNSAFFFSLVLIALGFGLILFLDRFNVTKESVKDVEDKQFEKEHAQALRSQKSGEI
jgi:putative membrane protein